MAVLDLSDVTLSLVTLIRQAFDVHPSLAGQPVLPEPPGRLTGEGIGIYMYHSEEDKTLANLPMGGYDTPPIRYTPMALKLYYQLCAHSAQDGSAYMEQRMMGIAMKTLHDYPFLDDSSSINGNQVFQGSMRGRNNRVHVTFQNVNPKESVSTWTAGDTPLRLSAYYEVSVVFLEPEETRSYTGRVLQYGTFIFAGTSPRISGTRNIIEYKMPPDNATAKVSAQPAQVPVGKTMDLIGSGFLGDQFDLRLYTPRWSGPGLTNSGWSIIKVSEDLITATISATATDERTGAALDVLPGVYGVQLIITAIKQMPAGDIKKIRNASNQMPFMICPRIDALAVVPGTLTITGYIFQHPTLDIKEIAVFLGEDRLLLDTDATFDPGEFQVTAPDTITAQLPGGLLAGTLVAVRVLISGVESNPAWIEIP